MIVRKTSKSNLENKRKIFFQVGMIVSLILIIAAFEYRTYDPLVINEKRFKGIVIIEDMIDVTIQKPPPPEEVPIQKSSEIKIIPDDLIDDAPDIEFDASDDGPMGEYDFPDLPVENPIIEDDSIHFNPESLPRFPGGHSEFLRYLSETLEYPELASKNRISGTVYIRFVLEKNGHVSNIRVERGVAGGCTEEAVRAVENMPAWEPARQWTKPVRYELVLPIKFTLK